MDVVAIIISGLSFVLSIIALCLQFYRYHVKIDCSAAFVNQPTNKDLCEMLVVENKTELDISIHKIKVTDPVGNSFSAYIHPVKIAGYDTEKICFPALSSHDFNYDDKTPHTFRFYASRGSEKQLTHKVIISSEVKAHTQSLLPQVIKQKK